jgi:hypothetical protein
MKPTVVYSVLEICFCKYGISVFTLGQAMKAQRSKA